MRNRFLKRDNRKSEVRKGFLKHFSILRARPAQNVYRPVVSVEVGQGENADGRLLRFVQKQILREHEEQDLQCGLNRRI